MLPITVPSGLAGRDGTCMGAGGKLFIEGVGG